MVMDTEKSFRQRPFQKEVSYMFETESKSKPSRFLIRCFCDAFSYTVLVTLSYTLF